MARPCVDPIETFNKRVVRPSGLKCLIKCVEVSVQIPPLRLPLVKLFFNTWILLVTLGLRSDSIFMWGHVREEITNVLWRGWCYNPHMQFIAFTTQIPSPVLSLWQSAILPVFVKFKMFQCQNKAQKFNCYTMRMGFEPMHAEHNGLAVHRLNHSATSSCNTYLANDLKKL